MPYVYECASHGIVPFSHVSVSGRDYRCPKCHAALTYKQVQRGPDEPLTATQWRERAMKAESELRNLQARITTS